MISHLCSRLIVQHLWVLVCTHDWNSLVGVTHPPHLLREPYRVVFEACFHIQRFSYSSAFLLLHDNNMTAAPNLQMFETGVQSEITEDGTRKIRLCEHFQSNSQIEDKHRWQICVQESDFDEFVKASPSTCSFVAAPQHWSAKIDVFVCCTRCSAVYRPAMQTLVFSLPMKTRGRNRKDLSILSNSHFFCGSRLKAL